MKRRVYFLRHGECQANIDDVVAGARTDSPLTDLGRKQAKSVAVDLEDVNFDLIVSSPLSRALQTAEEVAKATSYPVERIVLKQEFLERDVGEFTGMPKKDYFAREHDGLATGESIEAMQDRLRRGLDWLQRQEFKNALVVTHSGSLRMIQTILKNLPAGEFADLPELDNCDYVIVQFE